MLDMSQDSTCNYISFLDGMKEIYEIVPPEIWAMLDIILKNVEARDDFKWDIGMYIVSIVLKYPQTRKCCSRLIKSLVDTKDIKNYNWCRYTLEALIESYDNYQQKLSNHFCRLEIFLVVRIWAIVAFQQLL